MEFNKVEYEPLYWVVYFYAREKYFPGKTWQGEFPDLSPKMWEWSKTGLSEHSIGRLLFKRGSRYIYLVTTYFSETQLTQDVDDNVLEIAFDLIGCKVSKAEIKKNRWTLLQVNERLFEIFKQRKTKFLDDFPDLLEFLFPESDKVSNASDGIQEGDFNQDSNSKDGPPLTTIMDSLERLNVDERKKDVILKSLDEVELLERLESIKHHLAEFLEEAFNNFSKFPNLEKFSSTDFVWKFEKMPYDRRKNILPLKLQHLLGFQHKKNRRYQIYDFKVWDTSFELSTPLVLSTSFVYFKVSVRRKKLYIWFRKHYLLDLLPKMSVEKFEKFLCVKCVVTLKDNEFQFQVHDIIQPNIRLAEI